MAPIRQIIHVCSLPLSKYQYTPDGVWTDKGTPPEKHSVRVYPKILWPWKAKTLGVVKALKTSDNTPLAVMRTGSQAERWLGSGRTNCQHHARIDANYAINILGTVDSAGRNQNIQIDLGAGANTTSEFSRQQTALPGKAISSLTFPELNSDSRWRVCCWR